MTPGTSSSRTFAVVLLSALIVSAQQSSMRFDRVLLLEETSDTSANVSLGDLNGDGHLDVMIAKGRHWPLVDQVLLNDGKGNFRAKPLGTADRTYAGLRSEKKISASAPSTSTKSASVTVACSPPSP